MRNVLGKKLRENENKFYFQKLFSEIRAVYEIMWKNTVQPDRLQVAIWRMSIECWINKAINTHSEYVILIAMPQLQWLPESTFPISFPAAPKLAAGMHCTFSGTVHNSQIYMPFVPEI